MRCARKREDLPLRACRLGDGSPLEAELVRSGLVVRREDGRYEVRSLEARGMPGELAEAGDYVKLDSRGRPYPNERAFFEANHVRVGENSYRQISRAVGVWFAGDEMCPEIDFLLRSGRLTIDPADAAHYFSAELWGTRLRAAKDAAVVIYSAKRGPDGSIVEVSFNFVERREFERTYVWARG